LGEDIDVLYDFIHSGKEENRARNNKIVRDTEMANGMDRASGDYNDFWAGRDYLNQMKPMKAALLMSHGFNDWNVMPEHSYRISKRTKEMGIPTQIYYHQNGHGGPPPMKMMNRWFTRYLHGIDNGVEKDARAWIVRENDNRRTPTAYQEYPNPNAKPVVLHLGVGGNKIGKLTRNNVNTKEKETLIDNYTFSAESLAQTKNSNHRLLYVTSTLKKDLHLSGLPSITIKAASSKPAVNLSVYLVSLPWNMNKGTKITDNIITRGWADLQNHSSLTNGSALKPGAFYKMSFDFQPDDQIIKKGQQIGLMIFSSDSEYTILPEPGTKLTVDLKETIITLPIVGGNAAFKQAID
jgi:X-Pro dipeptidyl-peptidase